MNDFLIVIVIYETELKNCLTIQCLVAIKEAVEAFPEVVVYDNSLRSKYDIAYNSIITYYHHDPSNAGVSGAYNYAGKLGREKNKNWLILADQDTKLSVDYFKDLKKSVSEYVGINLFCPTIKSNNVIVSPTHYFFHKPISYEKPIAGKLKSRFKTVINSGLTIELSEMEKIGGYDSRLPLDYSDHYFFSQYKKRNEFFVVLNCEIEHNLSSYSDDTFEKVYSRFEKYAVSTNIYSRKVGSLFPMIWLYSRALKLTYRFSKFDFVKFLVYKK
jgi:GT2 family glycosyltransferase